jgi:hypothetical protein
MPNKLVNMSIREVSLVDKAANGKKFLLVKRAEPDGGKGGEQVNKSMLERIIEFAKGLMTEDDNADSVEFETFVKSADDIIKAGKKISKDRLVALKDMHQKLGDLLAGAGDEEDKGDGDKVAKNEEHVKGCKCDACMAKDDPVEKNAGVPEEIQKRMDTLEKRNQDLENQIKKQNDEIKTKEFIAKAAGYSNLGIKADEFGPVLKAMAETDPENFSKVEAVLQAADEQISKGALFAESGTDGVGETEITKRVEAKAKEIQKRDNCTIEKARTIVYKENPGMYAEYQNELAGVK